MPLRRPTILIVEDDTALRRLLSLSLRTAGFDTREAGDGMVALTLLELMEFDGVVLDLLLPGLDGFAIGAEIVANARTRTVPVIVITGSDLPVDNLNPACVLRKPVSPYQLVETVERCLRDAAKDRP